MTEKVTTVTDLQTAKRVLPWKKIVEATVGGIAAAAVGALIYSLVKSTEVAVEDTNDETPEA